MVIDANELAKRQRYIGASDVGIILGLNPWKTSRELWYDKVHGAKFKGNAATRRGNLFEPMVIKQFEEFHGCSVAEDVRFERHYELDGHTVMFAANCDGIVREDGKELPDGTDLFYSPADYLPHELVEAKTARSVDHWGLPGTDAIPDTYLVQVYTQMWCSGASVGWVPVQCGFDFYVYGPIARPDEADLEDMIRRCAEWWVKYVVPKVEPDGPPPKVSVLSTVPREEGSAIDLGPDMERVAEEWEMAKRNATLARNRADELKAQLIAALKNCEVGMTPNGHISYHANRNGVRTLKWNPET